MADAGAQPDRPPAWACALAGGAAGVLAALLVWLIPTLELATIDLRFQLRGPQPASQVLTLITLDDEALDAQGRWTDYARLIDALERLGAKMVLTDILFRRAGDDADSLVRATAQGKPVLHPLAADFFPAGDWPADGAVGLEDQPLDPRVLARRYPARVERGRLLAVDRLLAPHPRILAAAAGVGHIGVVLDPDGVLRRYPVAADLDGQLLPSLPLEAVRLATRTARDAVHLEGDALVLSPPDRAPLRIPLDDSGQALLAYRGGWEDPIFDHVQAAELTSWLAEPNSAPDLPGLVAGRICLIGVAGTGVTDLSPTPFDAFAPRMLALATLTDQLLADRHLTTWPAWLAWLLGPLLGCAVGLQAARRKLVSLGLATAAGVVLWGLAGQLMFSPGGQVLPVAGPLAAVALACGAGLALRFAAAERARRQVVAAFGRYLSPAVLDKVLAQGRLPVAERKTITILFSDIAAFSSYCDKVEPEQVHELLNEYLEEMVGCVFAQEGTVDKFIGDGLLAFFGDPLDQPDHAVRAVRAGLDMLARVEQLNARWRGQGRHEIQIRIGVNTGPAVVGNVGAARRMEYTVLGDAVNRAQRLEAAARPGCLLIGAQTIAQVRTAFPDAEPVGEVPGKRDERFEAWELTGPSPGSGGKRLDS